LLNKLIDTDVLIAQLIALRIAAST